jgi:hypothetical protein
VKNEKDNIELFKRYYENRYTKEDLQTIFSWFGDAGNDLIRRIAMNSAWSEMADRDFSVGEVSYDEECMLDSIHHRINQEEAETRQKRIRGKLPPGLFIKFSKIAAVLFIPLLITTLLYVNQKLNLVFPDSDLRYTELHAPPFGRISFYLDDSTRVWLNNGSSLRYPTEFSGRERTVFLNGEAYFDVREDPSHPFIVETGEINIKVLGTRFNISNYDEEPSIITTLEEGKILLRLNKGNGNSQIIHELIPSRQSVFIKESRDVHVKTVNTEKYTSWKEGKLFLLDDPMRIVKQKLERWYNVDIVIRDPEILNYTYTGTFYQETLDKVLGMMAVATPIRYSVTKGTKQKDNTYSKDVIFIMKK